jgi:hypothetical protein
MGTVIRKQAAVEDILADVRGSLARARAKAGAWQSIAEARLLPVVQLVDGVEAQRREADAAAAPARAARAAADQAADEAIGAVSDEVWNAVGRPQRDPAMAILFPEGIAHYTDGDVVEQPERMELLAQLLGAGVHPRLGKEVAQGCAERVRAAAATLRAAVDAARGPMARVELLGRTRVALARAGALELGRVKRLYKAEGFREAEIHEVIPNRPVAAPPAKEEPAPVG